MRRTIALVGSIALVTALFASPVTAAGGPPDGYSAVGHSASASANWVSCEPGPNDTEICTDEFVFGWVGFEVGDDAFPRGTALCLSLLRTVSDIDSGEPLEERSEFGCSFTPDSFQVAKDLGSASLVGSTEVFGSICVYPLGDPEGGTCSDTSPREVGVTANWIATGSPEKVKNRTSERSFGPDGKCYFRDTFSGTRREASATATLDSLALGPADEARIREGTGSFAEWCS
jgi:hypothetical protein